jgi:hypothetical protein
MPMLATLVLLLAVAQGGNPAQGDQGTAMTLNGVLTHYERLEGGVWTLKFKGTVYDLHGTLPDCASGDTVEIEGRAYPDRVCYHMVGTVFKVAKVTILKRADKD